MRPSTRILLQTTIAYDSDDWHIGRFGLLRACLSELRGGALWLAGRAVAMV